MSKQKLIVTLDTETADLQGHVYDFGWIIHDKQGNIVSQNNYIIEEVFTNGKVMMGAFFAKKIFSHYATMLEDGSITIMSWRNVLNKFNSDLLKHDVKTLAAYNVGFDIRALANTHTMLGNKGKILERELDILDIWQFACEAKLNSNVYRKVALDNGWVSPAGNIKTGAEFAYRFCIGDHGFIEDHTALSDCHIEVEILRQCFETKKKIPYGIYNKMPWRMVQRKIVSKDKDIHGSKIA